MKICELLKQMSIETWQRIGYARKRRGLKVFETTMTQNLLYTLSRYCHLEKDDSLIMFESINENSNGNDIECYIEFKKDEFVFIPMQAKIIYHEKPDLSEGTYSAFKYDQLLLLEKYALKKRGYPCYLFYNYSSKCSKCEYGCLVSPTYALKSSIGNNVQRKPRFCEILTFSKPIHEILCPFSQNQDSKFIESTRFLSNGNENLDESNVYSLAEVVEQPNWVRLQETEVEFTNSTANNLLNEEILESDKMEFLPKTKIVISSFKK